ncbi:MAG: hypothetical protein ABI824_00915 [Acidobacteriota bacterium]
MKPLLVALLAITLLPAATRPQTFTGKITDSECMRADHKAMQMGPTDAECTVACVNFHGASYMLFDGKNAYILSDQTKPEKFAGKRVTVTGTVDAKTNILQMTSIAAAK